MVDGYARERRHVRKSGRPEFESRQVHKMATTAVTCRQCGAVFQKENREINRASKRGVRRVVESNKVIDPKMINGLHAAVVLEEGRPTRNGEQRWFDSTRQLRV